MIAENNRPPELYPQFTTIEYTLAKATTLSPIFLYMVDLCMGQDEFDALKEAIQTSLSLLPADAFVGLVTFGRMVELHELNVNHMSRSFVFKVSLFFIKIYFVRMLNKKSIYYSTKTNFSIKKKLDIYFNVPLQLILQYVQIFLLLGGTKILD